MNTTGISNFRAILRQSLGAANRQLVVLFKNSLALVALLFLESIPGAALLALSFVLLELSFVLQIAAVLYFVYLFTRYNAALAYLLAAIPAGEKVNSLVARREAFPFLVNAYRTGVLVLFGQMFMVCACFLFLSNFIFSPYLYIYEGLKGDAAERRSVDLARGRGWRILNWTVALLLLNYLFFILALLLLSLFGNPVSVGAVGILLLYLGLLQSNFVHTIYVELLHNQNSEVADPVSSKYKFVVAALVAFVVLVYFILKIWSFYVQ